MSPEVSGRRSVVTIRVCLVILSEDYHFLLPVCFLLAIQLCSDASQKRVFSQIANSNCSSLFFGNFLFLFISHSRIWFIFVWWSLSVVEFVAAGPPPSPSFPVPDVTPEDRSVCVPAVCGVTTKASSQSRPPCAGITSSSLWAQLHFKQYFYNSCSL